MPKKRGTEIQLARGRLKGVLQDLVASSDVEDDSEVESLSESIIPLRGRPPKKKRIKKEINAEPVINPIRQSYVMKLFDRSLDLAKYKENTALYPICRAWMVNQPRSTEIKDLREDRTPSPEVRSRNEDLLNMYTNGSITEITYLPEPKPISEPRLPSPLPEQNLSKKENINLDYDLESPSISKEDILAEHKARWTAVKNKWNNKSKSYHQQRYVLSFELFDTLFNP